MRENLVEQIQSVFEDHFKKLGKLPENDDVFHDIALESELKRILAIPDRLSYLAKGIITQDTYNVARDHLFEVFGLVSRIESSDVNDPIKQRTINSILDEELITMIGILGQKVEEIGKCDDEDDTIEERNKIVKRVDIVPDRDVEEIRGEDIKPEDIEDVVAKTVNKLVEKKE